MTNLLSIFAILAIALPVTQVAYAVSSSPFVGHWQATDVDGSDIRLTIGGPPTGPFQITWTENYISFCDGEAGIVRGTGQLNESDPNLLEADLHLECLTTGASMDFPFAWRYHPITNTLSSRYENGAVTVWHRPGRPQPPPPALELRINYGHDWVESFYEADHMAWITVTESDGITVKATAELVTEPKDFWNGDTGFTTNPESWIPGPPDIQPHDWVFGWVDNGASAQVQIGDIGGTIDLANDSIEGTISAPWFSGEVDVDCHPWGAPMPEEILKYDAVLPDGEDTYSCSWAGEWDIQPGQDVGVGYSGPDGHWVANAFFIPLPSFTAYMPSAIEGYDWPLGNTITLNINDGEYTAQAISEQRPDFPEGETRVLFELWRDDFSMEAGDHILMMDEALGFAKELYVADLQVLEIDLSTQTVSGIYEPTYPDFRIWLDGQEPQDVQFDGNTWVASFADMTGGTSGSVAQDDWDHDGTVWDFNVPNTRFTVWPEWNYLEGYEWTDGAVVSISVTGKEVCSTEAVSGYPEWDPSNTFFSLNFPEGCAIEAGDLITLSSESLNLTHQVPELAITDVDLDFDTVAGTAVFDPQQYILHTWIHGVDESYMQLSSEGGTWLADFNSLGLDLQVGMGGRVESVDQASNATAVEWYISSPHFTVFPEGEWFDGYDWPDGATVNIAVQGKSVCDTVGISSGNFFNGGFPEGCDVVVDDIVTFTDGETVRTHTVQNLAITAVDKEANTVSGMADADQVFAWVHEYGYDMELQVDGGAWFADFGSAGLDLVEGMGGRAEIRDEFGNGTAVDWYIPNPHFTVFPLWEWFDAYEWPDGTNVTISVDGKPECGQERVSSGNFFNGGFPVGCDVAAGDTVIFTDGATTRTHIVRNLAVTAIDLEEETISGITDADTTVYVWPHDGWFDPLQAVADGSGAWQVDLSNAGYDLQEGASGRSEIRDDMGNATAVDWSINPRIIVHTIDDWFRAEGFMPNTSIDFWIYDAFEGNLLLRSSTAPTDNSGTVTHWVGDQLQIVPGNYVVVSDGTSTRDIVLEALTFDVFDTSLGILQGTAPDPFGRTVSFGIGCWQRDDLTGDVTTDESGVWTVDFGAPVPNDFGCVFAWIYDDEGDSSESRPEQIIWWSE